MFIGLVFIATGLYTFSKPLESYVALPIVFSISFIIARISEIAFSITNKEVIHNWGWSLVFGIFTLL